MTQKYSRDDDKDGETGLTQAYADGSNHGILKNVAVQGETSQEPDYLEAELDIQQTGELNSLILE